eukprot:CAMPEP_0170844864 /NCGR_PEP_ID=MMETSP0734-20130129/7183_1 /TAXON_ID=186038 /ORGANISM="Fragilariopsis kerguelensis, Strain L26-C5" /LENGTH=351 /DNA_ID=CAMNT_0011213457 /DNA_START=43 /DNA_END=1101 /DNA_ORIENTATION=+
MTDQEKISIANAKIIYLVAVSGCGKSFTGDYLQLMHGYTHVDGDGPLKKAHIPRNREMAVRFVTCWVKHDMQHEDGPEELWQPFYEEIANLTIEAAKHSDKVVISHATYQQSYRKYVVDKLVEDGATRENITVLELMIDPEVKMKGLYYRTKESIEDGGMTIGDQARTKGWEGEGDPTCAEWIQIMKETMPGWAGNGAYVEIPIGFGMTVDVSGRDMTTLDGVDDALGLVGKRNIQDLTFEEIRDKVKVFDRKRDEEWESTGSKDIFLKIWNTISDGSVDDDDKDDNVIDTTDTTEEQDTIAKRRSTLISADYLTRDFRRSSLSSLESTSDEKKKIMKARRSSLIKTGNIE